MAQILRSTYRNGVFVPQIAFDLPEGTEVELLIQPYKVVAPPISEPEAKQQFLRMLIERMQQNPIPMNAPRFTRDMLHERR
jgi:predicted DNA-binding antitoxin AbrB/MazE fold protein